MFNLGDRVRATSLTSGSGDVSFNDTYGGFQSFASGVGDGNQTYYAIENHSRFEIGLGTLSSNNLSRDIVFDSSDASGNKIHLDGVSTIFCTYPATHSIFLNPDGNVSGLLPRYSGIACPDGLVQTRAFIGSGNTGNVSYWSDENTIGGDDKFIWSDSVSELFVDGDVSISGNIINPTVTGDMNFISSSGNSILFSTNFETLDIGGHLNVSGDIINPTSTGNITFKSSSEYSLFHAFVNNGQNNIISLHSTDDLNTASTWKLGLKPYSTDFSDPPTHGYFLGSTNQAASFINSDNFTTLNYANGFWVRHRGIDMFNTDRDAGANIYNYSATLVPLTVNAAAAQSSNLQEWKNYAGSELASMSSAGSLLVKKLDIDGDTLRLRTSKTPSSASDTGDEGDISWDENYLYICVGTNTWKRILMSSW